MNGGSRMNFEEISNKVKALSRNTVEEVQKMNEIRQLNGKVNEVKKQIAALYSEIGKKLYDIYKDSPLEGFETEIQSISEKHEQILDIQNRIRGVKGVTLCPCCSMEVSVTERFCSNCGTKMPEIIEIVDNEEAAERIECVDVTGQDAQQRAAGADETADTPETAERSDETAEAVNETAGMADTPEEAEESVGTTDALEAEESVDTADTPESSEEPEEASEEADDAAEKSDQAMSEAAEKSCKAASDAGEKAES